ncbi:MAG: glucosidase, partial [Planctomycetaceae bacterium]|nr:glucosidase [Planctomycetaceae bacterium]
MTETLMIEAPTTTAEELRLAAAHTRKEDWQRWGPYLSERQWGTVREDYSPHGDSWGSFPHDQARSRAYRWGEDGLMGISDRQGRLCFALALWNGRDPILKERLFGLTGPEGNHGEDVKELYYYLDSTPTHSYMKALYKYPQAEYPYEQLIHGNRHRGKEQLEFELVDTGVFDGDRYFDVVAEYAKASPQDILIKITVHNRGPEAATMHLLPTLWFRNTWSWLGHDELPERYPSMQLQPDGTVFVWHEALGEMSFASDTAVCASKWLFTENVTNSERLHGTPNEGKYVKDAFHELLIHGSQEAVSPYGIGTKTAAWYELKMEPHSSKVIRMRLTNHEEKKWKPETAFGPEFEQVFATRLEEADEFYGSKLYKEYSPEAARVARQGYAGLLWTKQFYHYVVPQWLKGDEGQPPPPESRKHGRNHDWHHLFNRDVISMPDKWEYPWYAAWDLAFHMVPFARIDAEFAKSQLLLFLREWYMHPNGQLPAYEFGFGDVNPPVHAWACWRVYKQTGGRGKRDRLFLARAFQKLLVNFTWWVNRKDIAGNNMFGGGFLGLDNIGVFDRSHALPGGGRLHQADGTAWMASYCLTMLAIALELALVKPAYEDIASKFFEHFVNISDAINSLGGTGLWDDRDGFYYDQLIIDHQDPIPLRIRSLVGLLPMCAVTVLKQKTIDALPAFRKRMEWF